MTDKLTPLQKRVFTALASYKEDKALLKDPGITVRWVAKQANATADQTYRALRALEKKGLATKVFSGPGCLSFWLAKGS